MNKIMDKTLVLIERIMTIRLSKTLNSRAKEYFINILDKKLKKSLYNKL